MGQHTDLSISTDDFQPTDEALQNIEQIAPDPLRPTDEPLEEAAAPPVTNSIMYQGTLYEFPGDATDEEMLDFMGTLPDPEAEAVDERDPLREAKVIKKDEGVVKNKDGEHLSYLDSKKKLTGGHGHLMTKEEKKLYPKGTVIPLDVVNEWFRIDMDEADADVTSILEEKRVHVPDEVYDILINMTFNLGKPKIKKFKRMWAAIEVEDWDTAAAEMRDSKWFDDVGNRATRLIGRMVKLAPPAQLAESK